MYTLRKRCLPLFHSTSTTSRPSERATLSAASRIFSNCKQRLPGLGRSNAHYNRQTQKSGLAPTPSCDPLQSETAVYALGQTKARHRGLAGWRENKARPIYLEGAGARDKRHPAYGFG